VEETAALILMAGFFRFYEENDSENTTGCAFLKIYHNKWHFQERHFKPHPRFASRQNAVPEPEFLPKKIFRAAEKSVAIQRRF